MTNRSGNNGNSERLYIFGLPDHMSGATTMVHKPGREELPKVQGKEWWLCFTGAALKRYPTSKVRL